jgi:hypothetical protein
MWQSIALKLAASLAVIVDGITDPDRQAEIQNLQ